MRTILVLEPGLLTTVQDLGRPGHAAEGVAVSGAADALSFRVANRMVGNPDGAAALEMTLAGGAFRFETAAIVGIAGSDFGATREGLRTVAERVGAWRPLAVSAGDVVRFPATREGARAYLAVRGGIVVPGFLGSASTHLASGLGGLGGRGLRKGDRLELGEAARLDALPDAPDPASFRALVFRKTLRVVPGPQEGWFPEEAHRALAEAEFSVDEASDRAGLRLSGPSIAPRPPRLLLTEGVLPGHVQVTPDGRMIVLGVDGPTTGGYPKIAAVIAADLPAVGQLRPRDRVRFSRVDPETARAAWQDLLASVRRLAGAAIDRPQRRSR